MTRLLAIALLLSVGSWSPTLAAARDTSPRARAASTASYYLALGDSVTTATQTSAYPYRLLAKYRRTQPGLRLDDIGIGGETTTSMLSGQYTTGLGFLKAHKGHVALITIDVGGDDVAPCFGAGGVNQGCMSQAETTINQNLTRILAGLHKAAPGVPVVGMTYYNPFLGYWLAGGAFRAFAQSTVAPGEALNTELTGLYGGPSKVADVEGAFHATDLTTMVSSTWGEVPIGVARACSWLAITCREGQPEVPGLDPNATGEAHIAAAFERTIGELCAPGRSVVRGRCRSKLH
jgi:lysophospholipase L1-like esterase